MRNFILDYPNQFKTGFEIAKNIKISNNFNKVIVCGMGGSALPSDLLKTAINYNNIERREPAISIITNRSYYLPKLKNSIVFVSSYSGNTEEPVECFHKAKKRDLKMIGFAKGGKIEKLCEKNKIPFVKYPDDGPDFQPRFALGYSFTAMATVLKKKLGFSDKELSALGGELEKTSARSKANGFDYETRAKDLAKKLVGKIPVVYAGDRLKILARIWKIKFNETSKTPAFWNYFSELNHNEMVGYTNFADKFHFIILKDPDEHPRNLKRIEITSSLYKEKGAETTIIDLPGKNILIKMFANLWLADWVTYYLALENNVKPIPIKMVEDLKKMLV